MGSEAKAFQTIARRILAQVCSISSCEQNWSTPVPPIDDESRDAPSIQTFSIVEGLQQVRHANSMIVTNPTIDEIEPEVSACE